jgi:hypothetical protein
LTRKANKKKYWKSVLSKASKCERKRKVSGKMIRSKYAREKKIKIYGNQRVKIKEETSELYQEDEVEEEEQEGEEKVQSVKV